MTSSTIPTTPMSEASLAVPRHDSPRRLARSTAVFSLLTVLLGMVAEGLVSDRLIVWKDAALTASNIVAHRDLWLAGFAAYLVEMACNVVGTVLFYRLFKPAGPGLSLVALALGLVGCTIKTVARIFFVVPLVLLGRHANHALTPDVLNELSLALLTVNDRGAAVALVFFGFHTTVIGWLMLRSRFLPRILGVLGILGGAGWLAFLWPPLGYRFFPFIAGFALLGFVGLTFWLLVFGVDEARWRQREGSR